MPWLTQKQKHGTTDIACAQSAKLKAGWLLECSTTSNMRGRANSSLEPAGVCANRHLEEAPSDKISISALRERDPEFIWVSPFCLVHQFSILGYGRGPSARHPHFLNGRVIKIYDSLVVQSDAKLCTTPASLLMDLR